MREPHRIAILFSDLHLSLTAPACRADDDWLLVQAGYLGELKTIAKDLPVIVAGDIFDKWNVQPELINFALKYLPDNLICVPGQHDLPNHSLDEIHRSGYGVLVEAGKIVEISGKSLRMPGDWTAYGFGWNQEITPPLHRPGGMDIAVIHRYVWTTGSKYPGAHPDAHLYQLMGPLKGYQAALCGDNHQFIHKNLKNGCSFLNPGTFIIRKSDERNHKPCVGVLYSDGSIKVKYLDTSGDKFHEGVTEREELAVDMRDFIASLEELGEHGLNFREAVKRHLRGEEIDERTKQIILKAIE